jgi:hypothetical protein
LMLKNSYISHPSGQLMQVVIVMTEYRLIFIPSINQSEYMRSFHVPDAYLQVPLSCIERIEREKKQVTSILACDSNGNIMVPNTCHLLFFPFYPLNAR